MDPVSLMYDLVWCALQTSWWTTAPSAATTSWIYVCNKLSFSFLHLGELGIWSELTWILLGECRHRVPGQPGQRHQWGTQVGATAGESPSWDISIREWSLRQDLEDDTGKRLAFSHVVVVLFTRCNGPSKGGTGPDPLDIERIPYLALFQNMLLYFSLKQYFFPIWRSI